MGLSQGFQSIEGVVGDECAVSRKPVSSPAFGSDSFRRQEQFQWSSKRCCRSPAPGCPQRCTQVVAAPERLVASGAAAFIQAVPVSHALVHAPDSHRCLKRSADTRVGAAGHGALLGQGRSHLHTAWGALLWSVLQLSMSNLSALVIAQEICYRYVIAVAPRFCC